jgi:DNA-directed RNA polymerase specialized sigma24 family protein
LGVVSVVSDAKLVAMELCPTPETFAPAWETFDRAATESFDEALINLYHDHAESLVEMLWVFVGDRAEAEDLTQEAFVRLHLAWPRLDHGQNVGGYLRATAFNLARSGFRRRRVRLRHPSPGSPDVASAEDDAMLSDDQERVIAAVRIL